MSLDHPAALRRRRLAVVRPLAVASIATALVVAWGRYCVARPLPRSLVRYLGDLLPIYADARAIDLATRGTGLLVAIAACLAATLAIVACVATRRPTWLCLAVAVAGILGANVAVGYLRNGHAGFLEPFSRRALEYHPIVPLVRDDPLTFVRDYPTLGRRLGQHPGTHPPGGVLFLWAGERLFGPAPPPPSTHAPTTQEAMQQLIARLRSRAGPPPDPTLSASVWCAVSFTALGVLPAFWLATLVGGASAGRRLLPIYACAPNLVLFGATCMDGVFLVFVLTALAAGVAAVRRRGWWWPIVAGVALWQATFMTFAAVAVPTLLATLVLVDACRRPRAAIWAALRCAAVGVVFVACQLLAQRTIGYDLRACAERAMRFDATTGVTGYESFDVWRQLSVGNALALVAGSGVALSALFAVALGESTIRGRLLRDPATRFGIALAVTVVALACSTLFTMETERVWLFLTPAAIAAATRAYRGRVMWALVPVALLAQALWVEVYYKTWW